jgi:hypothetical protein
MISICSDEMLRFINPSLINRFSAFSGSGWNILRPVFRQDRQLRILFQGNPSKIGPILACGNHYGIQRPKQPFQPPQTPGRTAKSRRAGREPPAGFHDKPPRLVKMTANPPTFRTGQGKGKTH